MERIKLALLAWGLPGLFLIAFLDSAGIPLPGGVDVVVLLLSWQRPAIFPLVALIAALGSTIGCYVLYRIGKKGGEVALSRFSESRRERVAQKIRDNDILTVSIAMLGPPPFPTKLFILMAGFVEMKPARFVAAVFFGRTVRFMGEGYLGVRLGDQAAETLRQHYPAIGAVLLVLFVAGLLARRSKAVTSEQ